MITLFENRQWWNEEEHMPEPHVPFGQFREFSKFPAIVRDVTLTKKPNNGNLLNILLARGKYLEKVFKTGEYEPKNNETFRLIFQSKYKTLEDSDIPIK